ncbi:hypothetical protein AAES_103535 [Amazona aestiva]|uniref:Uncharacterized protein n=1 Tax=Amazona aestiva TaxID=12930 RepID=A0A0Q3PTR9_AMAAE|nr:hypothetical protein AAES_103535 [Amazona aestiva]
MRELEEEAASRTQVGLQQEDMEVDMQLEGDKAMDVDVQLEEMEEMEGLESIGLYVTPLEYYTIWSMTASILTVGETGDKEPQSRDPQMIAVVMGGGDWGD